MAARHDQRFVKDPGLQAAPGGAAAAPDWRALVLVPMAALIGLLWLETTDVDRTVEGWFFDPVRMRFPLRYDAFLEVVMHHWAKYAVILLGCLALAAIALSYLIESLKPQRRVLWFIVLSLALAPAAVTAIKLVSGKHCPWELKEYGGSLPYARLFEQPASGAERGRCFPAGHASTGFALMLFYFVGRARGRPRWAWTGLGAGLVAGMVLGGARMLQGAHFVSHTLWSALVCWIVLAALAAVILRGPAR